MELPDIVQGYNDALVELDSASNRLGCLVADAVREKMKGVEAYLQKQVWELMQPYSSGSETLNYLRYLHDIGVRDHDQRRAYESGDPLWSRCSAGMNPPK